MFIGIKLSNQMKIRKKIVSVFSLIILISIFAVGYFYYATVVKIIHDQVKNNLEGLANSQEVRVEESIDRSLERFSGVSKLTNLLMAFRDYNEDVNEEKKLAIRSILIDVRNSIPDFINIFIINDAGLVTISADTALEGQDYSRDILYVTGMDKEHLRGHIHFSTAANNENHLYTHGPLMLDNNILGVIVIETNTDGFIDITSDYAGLGETGETDLAKRDENGDAVFLHKRRFESPGISNKISKENYDVAITRALQKNENIFENALDYRGVRVMAVTRYIASADWGLVVKIDESELSKPTIDLRNKIMVVGIISLLFSFIVLYIFSRLIIKPIEVLHQGAEYIEKGDYNFKVGIKTNDEIGQLSRAFDKMTMALKKSRVEIEKRVEEQTKDIEEKNVSLEKQQKAILNILEDIADEKEKVSQEKEKIDSILHSIGDGVFVIDQNYNIIIYNQMAADISGYSKEEAIGKRCDKVLKFIFEDTKKVNYKFIKDVFATGEIKSMSNHTLLVKKGGAEIPVADSAAPIKDRFGKVFGCIVVFRDVTHEREVDKAKTEFVSLASHQLRTPLSAINWYTEMLLSEKKIDKKHKNYLNQIYGGSQRMVELVNALLNVSRLELGTFIIEPKPFDITKIADEAVKEISQEIKKKKIRFAKKYDKNLPQLPLDNKLTHMIFQNILSNAVKYSQEKGKVALDITKDEKNIKIAISDNGMGIPQKQHRYIFNKLFRADNARAEDSSGTGLGLYIVKSILDQSGGKVWFESVQGKGTTFYVEIPLAGMKAKEGLKELS